VNREIHGWILVPVCSRRDFPLVIELHCPNPVRVDYFKIGTSSSPPSKIRRCETKIQRGLPVGMWLDISTITEMRRQPLRFSWLVRLESTVRAALRCVNFPGSTLALGLYWGALTKLCHVPITTPPSTEITAP
jgi:hypothetical protein